MSKTDHQRTVAAAVVLAHARAHGAAVEALEKGPMFLAAEDAQVFEALYGGAPRCPGFPSTRALQAVHMAMADEYTRSAKQLLGDK